MYVCNTHTYIKVKDVSSKVPIINVLYIGQRDRDSRGPGFEENQESDY